MAASERWRPVVGYEGRYEVSNLGRVKSLRRVCDGAGRFTIPERILAQAPTRTRRDGVSRKVVSLWRDREMRWARVPHLVLEAFKGPRPSPAHEARHLNCNPSDDRSSNLAWGTQTENHADTLRLDHIDRGEQHAGAKLTAAQVLQIRELRAAGQSGPTIAARFGITHPLVYMIAKRKAWKHV